MTEENISHQKLAPLSKRTILLGVLGVVLLYVFFTWGITTNPPGFYVDESCIAYNGYLIATTGRAENGTQFPLYFQCYTQGYSQYMSAGQPYALAVLYLFVQPSIESARMFAATLVFSAILILGFLAFKISGRRDVGIIVSVTGVLTPWLFEIGRLVQETFFLIFCIVVFLFCLNRAYRRRTWKFTDSLLIALFLMLITYCYATGRMIAPLLAFGLVIFVRDLRSLLSIAATWFIYGITIIPMVYIYFTRPAVISGRFWMATNLSPAKTILQNIGIVLSALYEDVSLKFFVFDGDQHLRHHVPGMGEFLVGTFALGLFGILIILLRHRKSAWWWFILYGAFVSVLPGAITYERSHAMRDLAFPIFFLLLTVPAISWLLGGYGTKGGDEGSIALSPMERYLRVGLLCALMLLTAVQAIQFQRLFSVEGRNLARELEFDGAYPRVLSRALAEESRPIYLDEGPNPAYIHAFWYGTIQGVDRSNFVHLLDYQMAPEGALVLTSEGTCEQCEVIYQDGGFLLYRNLKPDPRPIAYPAEVGKNG